MNKKIILTTIIIILIIMVVLCFCVFIYPWIALRFGITMLPNPYKPEITYGEFPFCLKYEIKGEQVEVNDVLICEYDGVGFDTGRGKYRKWKSRLKSGNTRITLFKSDEIEIFYSPGLPSSRIAGVYMGDTEEYPGTNEATFPNAWYTSDFEDKTAKKYIITSEEMLEKYQIRLISWEPSKPIKNTFK